MKRTIRYAALAAAVIAGGAVVILQTVGSSASESPLNLPAVDQFTAGTCRQAAPAILGLAEVTLRNVDDKTLSRDARNQLVTQGNSLVEIRAGADAPVAAKMTEVLARIGYIRIRPGDTYDAKLLADLETARADLQSACTG